VAFLSVFGDYRFLAGCGFVTAVTCYALALLILLANRQSHLCRVAVIFKISVGTWSLFNGVMYFVGEGELGLLVNRVLTVAAFYIGSLFLHLTAGLTGCALRFRKAIVANYFYSTLASCLVIFTTLVVTYPKPKLDFEFYTVAGPFYFLLPAQMICCVVLSILILQRCIRGTDDASLKKQLQIFLGATFISFVTGMSAYLLVYDIPVKPITTPFVIIYPIVMAYVIVKHRFLDIRKLARNTLVFSLLFVCLLVVVSTLLFLFQKLLLERLGLSSAVCRFLAIFIALMLYSPLKRGLSAATRKLLYQHAQDAAVIFQRLSEDLFKFMEVKKLADEMTLRVTSCLSLERIAFYRREPTHNRYKLHSFVGSQKVVKDEFSDGQPLIQHLKFKESVLLNPCGGVDGRQCVSDNKREMIVNAGSSHELALNELIEGDWAVALPIFDKNQLDSLILMGNKKSDASWTQEELDVLESFSRCFSLALLNADAAEAIRTLQRKILASERDASAGALISGVDHEAKNPLHAASLALSSLEGFLSNPKFLAQTRHEQETCVQETMQSVLEDIEEVNYVIQHLSNLAEQKPLQIRDGIILKEVCRKALKTSGSADNIRMTLDFQETFVLICDSDALQEILSNLIRNAAQAKAAELWIKAYYEPNASAVIEVRDSGHGIPATIAQRIFDPFFTTKEREETDGSSGTGMGLFIVRESMRAMGGDIELVSGAKQGTVFKLLFRGFPSLKAGAVYES